MSGRHGLFETEARLIEDCTMISVYGVDRARAAANLRRAGESALRRLQESAVTDVRYRLPTLPIPLDEPVNTYKAVLAERKAEVRLDNGVGPKAMVSIVNVGLTGWTHTKETATAFADGYNKGKDHLLSALRDLAEASNAPPPEVAQQSMPWVIQDADGKRYRAFDGTSHSWVTDADAAMQFARRQDAELWSREDEDAWRIVQIRSSSPITTQATESDAQLACAEAYQIVGEMSDGIKTWTDKDAERALDNFVAASQGLPRPHDDLLPWPREAAPTRSLFSGYVEMVRQLNELNASIKVENEVLRAGLSAVSGNDPSCSVSQLVGGANNAMNTLKSRAIPDGHVPVLAAKLEGLLRNAGGEPVEYLVVDRHGDAHLRLAEDLPVGKHDIYTAPLAATIAVPYRFNRDDLLDVRDGLLSEAQTINVGEGLVESTAGYCVRLINALLATAPQPHSGEPDQFQAAADSGDLMRLAAQIAGKEPCEKCDYVLEKCRCEKSATGAGVLDVSTDQWFPDAVKDACLRLEKNHESAGHIVKELAYFPIWIAFREAINANLVAPPTAAIAVPDAQRIDRSSKYQQGWTEGWNCCRAAILAAAPQPPASEPDRFRVLEEALKKVLDQVDGICAAYWSAEVTSDMFVLLERLSKSARKALTGDET